MALGARYRSRSRFENWTTVLSLYSWNITECDVKPQPTNQLKYNPKATQNLQSANQRVFWRTLVLRLRILWILAASCMTCSVSWWWATPDDTWAIMHVRHEMFPRESRSNCATLLSLKNENQTLIFPSKDIMWINVTFHLKKNIDLLLNIYEVAEKDLYWKSIINDSRKMITGNIFLRTLIKTIKVSGFS